MERRKYKAKYFYFDLLFLFATIKGPTVLKKKEKKKLCLSIDLFNQIVANQHRVK